MALGGSAQKNSVNQPRSNPTSNQNRALLNHDMILFKLIFLECKNFNNEINDFKLNSGQNNSSFLQATNHSAKPL